MSAINQLSLIAQVIVMMRFHVKKLLWPLFESAITGPDVNMTLIGVQIPVNTETSCCIYSTNLRYIPIYH